MQRNPVPTPPERVALYAPSMRGGGAERVMLDLANDFADRGLEVDLVLVNAEGPYLKNVSPRVRLVDLKASRSLKSLPGLVRYLRRERPAALLATIGQTNLLAVAAKRLAGVPVRVVVRESNVVLPSKAARPGGVGRFLTRQLYLRADAIVTPSRGVAENLCERLRLPPERVTVIYSPVISPELLRKGELPLTHEWFGAADPVILAVGRLTQQKNFASLIRAFAQVRACRPAKLLILGEGEERQRLTELIDELDLREDVALPGFVDNPFPYMRHANVFVLSSLWEGLPNVLIQALALGAPVVATNCRSGSDEILEGGKYGPLVPVDDDKRLAEALSSVLDNPTRPVDEHWRSRFAQETASAQYVKLLGLGTRQGVSDVQRVR